LAVFFYDGKLPVFLLKSGNFAKQKVPQDISNGNKCCAVEIVISNDFLGSEIF